MTIDAAHMDSAVLPANHSFLVSTHIQTAKDTIITAVDTVKEAVVDTAKCITEKCAHEEIATIAIIGGTIFLILIIFYFGSKLDKNEGL